MPQWWEKQQHYAEWQALKTPEGLTYYYNGETGETTWDKPDALKTEEELAQQGEWVWMPDDQLVFRPARLQGEQGNMLSLITEDGQMHTIRKQQLERLKLSSLQRVVSDLVLLDNMTAPLILHNLRKRFENHDIYTNIGTILVSINPYTPLPLYTPEVIEQYQHRGVKEMPPHVFNIAHDAFKGLKEFQVNQSIIISGESGAGKTEATKQCLQYLAATAGSVGGIEQKVLQANPVLEAFGNAKTLRNDNSSRFGKYMEIFFNGKTQICGSVTTNYLLEKVRVMRPGENERTFHIFYQIAKAADQSMRKQFSIAQASNYHNLTQSGCIDVETIDDAIDFSVVLQAFQDLGFTTTEQGYLFSVLSLVLALGNLTFRPTAQGSEIADQSWLKIAAHQIGVDAAVLSRALTIRELKIKGQQNTTVGSDPKKASDTRDALGKFVYAKMFDWLVDRINLSMGQPPAERKLTIGILDIFGFEIFGTNSFEQLCINFCNEMLQQHFNNQTFKLEEQVYKQEKIQFQHVDFIDNQVVLDLIMKKPQGLLCQLDEELIMPKGSDKTFLLKVQKIYGKNRLFGNVIANPDYFFINHYAGQVVYDTTGFLEKNRDTMTEDLVEMLHTARSPFIQILYPADATMTTRERKQSLGSQFSQQLQELMYELNLTEPHYIRCIKPNGQKSAITFIPRMCYEQLMYSGVFEAVRIRKLGFPFRLKHDVFYNRYRCILPDPTKAFHTPVEGCKAICGECKLAPENVQQGVSMMLYRSEEHKKLELQRNIRIVAIELNDELTKLVAIDIKNYNKDQKEKYFEQLSKVVHRANEMRLKTPSAEKARQLLDFYIESRIDDETKAMLQRAKDACDEAGLREALRICDQNKYDTKLVKECRRLIARIDRITQEAMEAGRTLEEKHVIVCVQAADEIRYNQNQWIDYFRSLINGPPDVFMQAQFDKARELQQHDRAIRIGIRMKDYLIKTRGMQFDIRNYNRLKSPEKWFNEKFFTLFTNKEELMRSQMVWQAPKVIHAPLTEIMGRDEKETKLLLKKARKCHRYLLKYMGDRQSKIPIEHSREMVLEGLSTPEIRTEIYVQIIKQLSNNPNPDSRRRGFGMLGLCLNTFPPSPDFEDYLEAFLRLCPEAQNMAQMQFKYTGYLRKCCYQGPASQAPTLQELAEAEPTLLTRNRGFSEPLPPGAPSYQDLLGSYYAQDPIENEFHREAPLPAGVQRPPAPDQQQQGMGRGSSMAMRGRGGGPMRGGRGGGPTRGGMAGRGGPQQPPQPQQPYPQQPQQPQQPPQPQQPYPQQYAQQPQQQQYEQKQPMPPSQARNPWRPMQDPASGETYYYNEETGQSQWDKPAALRMPRPSMARGW